MGYGPIKVAVGPALEMLYQPWIRGEENIPAEGAAILASNHLAVIDSFFLPLLVDREVAFIGKADYFTGKGIKGWAVKSFMRTVGTIPVDRSGGKASQAALQAGIDRLRSGELFGIYPEGTRSPDGRLYRGKTGVARVALATGAPVVPVAMIGSNLAQPIGQAIPSTRHRVGIVVGEALDFSRYQGLENDRFVLRSITDEIMYALMALSGQEYVDLYAADVKNAMDAEKKTAEEVVTQMLAAQAQARPSVAPVAAPGGRPAPDVEVPEPPEDTDAGTDSGSGTSGSDTGAGAGTGTDAGTGAEAGGSQRHDGAPGAEGPEEDAQSQNPRG